MRLLPLLLLGALSLPAAEPCVFCDIVAGKRQQEGIVYRDDRVTAFLSIGQRNPGHVLVVPNAHAETFMDVPADTMHHLTDTAQKIIASGAVGCLIGGWAADRVGRTAVTIASLAVSGACALVMGFAFGGPAWLVLLIGIIWGVTVVSDSAQFSASVTELSDRTLVGTMLTVQTCIGFLLTLITIHVMPYVVSRLGWTYAFMILAIGPAIGIWAMARLRADPTSVSLAGGRR